MNLGIHCRKAKAKIQFYAENSSTFNDKGELQSGNMVLMNRSVCIELKFAVPPHLSLSCLGFFSRLFSKKKYFASSL